MRAEAPWDAGGFGDPGARAVRVAAIDHVARAVKAAGEPVLGMHSINSERREIVDGQIVRVFNDRGSSTLRIRFSDRAKNAVASVLSRWWASATLSSRSANSLTADGLSASARAATSMTRRVKSR